MRKNIFLLAFIMSINAYSQKLDSIYRDTMYSINGVKDGLFVSNIIVDADNNDENWFFINDNIERKCKIYKISDSQSIIKEDSIEYNSYPIYKFNDVFYGIQSSYRIDSNNVPKIDSSYISRVEIKDKALKYSLISDTLIDYLYQYVFLKEKSFAILSTPYLGSGYLDSFKISIIDTLGGLLRCKIFNQKIYNKFSIKEQNEYLVVSGQKCNISNAKVYFINKNTLEIEDSIDGECYSYIRVVNDSMLIGVNATSEDLLIDIINKHSKTKNQIIIKGEKDFDSDRLDILIYTSNQEYIDFRNKDSIYLSYYVYHRDANNPNSLYVKMHILNFGINGMINFNQIIPIAFHKKNLQINGIKATNDRGLLIAALIMSVDATMPFKCETWLIKFNPNGFVGLSNVETGERASLRVYPNPAKDFVLVDIEADRFVEADIEIYDLGGRMVKKSKLSAKVGNRIDVSDLKAGVYSYRVVLNGKGVSGKIVIGE